MLPPVSETHSAVHPPRFRKRIAFVAALLLLSGIAFCVAVSWNRDLARKTTAQAWAGNVREWLESSLTARPLAGSEWSLPSVLPDEFTSDRRPLIPYPPREDVYRLRYEGGPFVIVSSPRQGLITPGADGCAAVLFDHGKVSVVWLTDEDARAELAKRDALLGR